MFLNPQPDSDFSEKGRPAVSLSKRISGRIRSKQFQDYARISGKLLDIHCGDLSPDFPSTPGISVTKVILSPSKLPAALSDAYDACSMVNVLQKIRSPEKLLEVIWRSLKDDGALMLVTPTLDTRGEKMPGEKWWGFDKNNFFFFDNKSIRNLLLKSGFGDIFLTTDFEYLQLDKVKEHFSSSEKIFRKLVAKIIEFLPKFIKKREIKIADRGTVVFARKKQLRTRPLLSIIVPVYNEARTFPKLYALLKDKKSERFDKEIIIVESHSNDGTREAVEAISADPGVKVIWEDRPRGKGHAVRIGLTHVSGDFILIQDGDLEYDLNDYDQLIDPLLDHRELFVLGSRHSNGWKMRHFADQPLISFIMNLGQTFFTRLLNLFCGSSMKDPFTMFKVFHRDCIHGLSFKANRFDFDFELVMKLIRKGYSPLEIAVNYNSRSFNDGKKVSFMKDPILWIIALFRFRFCDLYENSGPTL